MPAQREKHPRLHFARDVAQGADHVREDEAAEERQREKDQVREKPRRSTAHIARVHRHDELHRRQRDRLIRGDRVQREPRAKLGRHRNLKMGNPTETPMLRSSTSRVSSSSSGFGISSCHPM